MTPSLPCTRSPHGTREGRAPALAAAKACLCSLVLVGAALLSTGPALRGQTTFGPQQVITTSATIPVDVLAADLGRGEHPDVLVADYAAPTVGYHPNLGGGDFGPLQVISSGDYPNALYAADVDGDGDQDVLVTYRLSGVAAWHENTGSGFGPTQVITTVVGVLMDVIAADLDGDGDLDVLLASFNPDLLAWNENLGGGGFGPQQVITTSAPLVNSVDATDLDGDGDIDVLAASTNDGKVTWYENLGGGSFGPQQVITTSTLAGVGVHAADLDGDGDPDVLSASILDFKIAWYENLGGGSFGPQQLISTAGAGPVLLFAIDLDGDGDIDVTSAGATSNEIAWHENLGGGSFGPKLVISTEVMEPTAVYAADLDGDGDADVLSSSLQDGKIAWYENLSPPAPQQFIATTCWGTDAGSPPTIGQSFTADASGNVTAIAMHLQYDQASAGSLILSLYEGSGFAGAELHTQLVRPPYEVGTITPIVDVVLATAVPVVSGQVYTIGVMNTDNLEGGGGFCGTEADVYSGGSYIHAGNPMVARDAAFKVTISPDEPTAWSNEGYALAGFAGDPVLVGSGTLVAGSSNAVVLSHAAPSALAAFFQSAVGTAVPFKGGTLKAFPFFDPPVLVTAPDGTLPIPFVMPPGFPAGIEIWDQWAIKDLAAPNGVALSNAVRGLFP